MERLLDLFSDKFTCKLVRSYRAHPALMNVSTFSSTSPSPLSLLPSPLSFSFLNSSLQLYNALFYKGELINCADPVESTSLLKWKELPNPLIPLMFVNCEDEEARDPDSPSWYELRRDREREREREVGDGGRR